MSWVERKFLHECLLSNTPIVEIPKTLKSDPFHQINPLMTFLRAEPIQDDVTVVIPTHRQVPIGLEAWKYQASRILVLQNGDFNVPMSDVQCVSVQWQGHGKTRQSTIHLIETPYVFFTVDDAIPLSGLLQKSIACLECTDVDAVVARQIPFPIADPRTRDDLAIWTPFADRAYEIPQTDHVGTLYRTRDLVNTPIPDVPIAEDVHWSIDKRIVCLPDAVLVHSHPRCFRSLVFREFQIHQELHRLGKSPQLQLNDAIVGGLSSIFKYGLREGLLSTAQNLARFAAQRVARHPTPY